jgi:hypothetical protein
MTESSEIKRISSGGRERSAGVSDYLFELERFKVRIDISDQLSGNNAAILNGGQRFPAIYQSKSEYHHKA